MEQCESNLKERLRIGVFVCHCGINIGGVVKVPEVVKSVEALPGVVYAEDNLYTCSAEGIDSIKNAIRQKKLNRVVVASCTPRTHEPLFRAACQDAGLNPYLFEFANIREHCSWVHMHEPEKATEKAKDIVRMSVAKASFLEPQKEAEVEVEPSALVIGAGISGIMAALCLANQGIRVYLIEKEAELGGMLKKIYKVYPTDEEAAKVLKSVVETVKDHKDIKTFTFTTVKNVEGYIGNFEVTVIKEGNKESKFKVGTIIIATGALEFEPVGRYGYDKYERVITQLQLEQILKDGRKAVNQLVRPEKVVMIQCVGSREEGGRAYCSRICCMVAIKNAILIKKWYPDAEVYILYQELQTYGKDYERHHRKAREAGIKFINYTKDQPAEVTAGTEGRLKVKAYHALLGEETEFECDLVVLSTPLVQHQDGKDLSKILKVPLGQDEFFLEAHVKLRPVDFATDGVYVCGTAHGPKDIGESVAQAYAVASRAAIPIANRRVRAEAITAVVNQELCVGCRLCEKLCPFGAHIIEEKKSIVIEALCKGCGVCAAACLRRAITMKHFTDDQILAAIKAVPIPEIPEPRILGFLCNWCSYAGADLAGVSRISYPTNMRVIRTMCSGRVDSTHILESFRSGFDGVLVSGCHPGDCHYINGNYAAEKRTKFMKRVLSEIGIDPRRLRLEWISASEGGKFAEVVKEMVEEIRKLGPSPLRRVE